MSSLSVGTSPEPATVPIVSPVDSLSSASPWTARQSWVPLGLLFSVELVIFSIFNSAGRSFDFWAFSDSGANLTVQNLLKQGLRPGIDFGYHYGLLPLLVGRLWFALFGSTPRACDLLTAFGTLLVCFAVARFAIRLRLGLPSLTLLFLALPIATATGPNLAHVLEAALIANALADQAAENHERSLALAGAAAFAKPSIAYLYGGLLLLLIAWHLRIAGRLTVRALWRAVRPTIVVVLVIGTLLASVYGAKPLLRTLVPIEGLRAYAALNYGFLREGRNFWHPPGARIGYYAGTVAGFWLAGTLWVVVCGVGAACRFWRDSATGQGNAANEIIVCCALLHTSFVVFFFGNAFSWIYYCYVLVMGVAATVALDGLSKYLLLMLALMSALGQKASFVGNHRLRSTGEAGAETAYLWATAPERREWQQVLRLLGNSRTADGQVVVLDEEGCVELLYPRFAAATTLYLFPGLATPKEVDRKLHQLSKASIVVVPSMEPLYQDFLRWWPQFSSALEPFQPVMKGTFFTVYRRRYQSDCLNGKGKWEVEQKRFLAKR